MSRGGWGVKKVRADGTATWYTNERHKEADAKELAAHYNQHSTNDPLSDKPVTYRAEEIPEGDNY